MGHTQYYVIVLIAGKTTKIDFCVVWVSVRVYHSGRHMDAEDIVIHR